MRILILGGSGQVGSALRQTCVGLGELVVPELEELDFADPAAVAAMVETVRPAAVFNAAAYTAVDRAETESDLVFRINAQSPGALAAACQACGALLVHYSTDYVFDGRKMGRYSEQDQPAPLGVYGASKLAGERNVLDSGAAAVVLRTSWVYGDEGGNFARTMLRLAMERDALRVVMDQHGTPTWAGRLAELSVLIVRKAFAEGSAVDWLTQQRGLYHATAAGATTWADYARCVLATAAEHPSLAARLKVRAEDIVAIPSSEYPAPAARPTNSLLDSSRLERTFGYRFPDWQDDVRAFIHRIAPTYK